jgi:hypothetical protein
MRRVDAMMQQRPDDAMIRAADGTNPPTAEVKSSVSLIPSLSAMASAAIAASNGVICAHRFCTLPFQALGMTPREHGSCRAGRFNETR